MGSLSRNMNTSRSQSLVYTVNWCRSSQHRLPPNKMCQNIVKKVPSRKYHNKQFTARLNLCRDFSQTTYQPPDDPFSRKPRPGSVGAAIDELDQLGAWDSSTVSPSDNLMMEESSLRHGTIIPVIGSNRVGTCCHQGRREYQEDRFLVMQLGVDGEELPQGKKMSSSGNATSSAKHHKNDTNILLLAFFDGHGGEDCANYCKENIHRLLMRNLEQKSGFGAGLGKNQINPFQTVDLKKALTDTVLELSTAFGRYWENNFLPYVPRHIESSGATCHVPHRSYKSATGVSPGSTATIALL